MLLRALLPPFAFAIVPLKHLRAVVAGHRLTSRGGRRVGRAGGGVGGWQQRLREDLPHRHGRAREDLCGLRVPCL